MTAFVTVTGIMRMCMMTGSCSCGVVSFPVSERV